MLFSSLLFLYFFLPLTLILGLGVSVRFRNALLLVASILFYAWGGVSHSFLMIGSIAFNYLMALSISRADNRSGSRTLLALCVFGNLLLLGIMKYSDFAVTNLNALLHRFHIGPLEIPEIALPAGISFFTFHAISYVVDIYRKECPVQKNPVNLALYISFFPQLIAGPIIRYHDIENQLENRKATTAGFISGVERFILGLAKKVLFSNVFALPAGEIFSSHASNLNAPLAWFGAVCYALHIYCDFSGYSDMALGLGRMFGFHFPENFNFPYLATSLKDFWRRWHISLSTWFRDYVYVPLGGNRKGRGRTYLNLLLVFFLTGLWHGASWNFVIWGFIHGTFLILERLFLGKWLEKVPGLNRLYTLFVVINAWVFFNSPELGGALDYLKIMYGALPGGIVTRDIRYYLSSDFLLVLFVGLAGCAGLFEQVHKLNVLSHVKISNLLLGVKYAGLLFLLFICSVCLLCNSYNPFIYFRF